MSTEQSFRQNLSQFRWARGNNNDSTTAQEATAQPGPFGRFYNAIGASSYIPLRSSETSNEQEAFFALSRWDRCVLHVERKRYTLTNIYLVVSLGYWALEPVSSEQLSASLLHS